MSGKPPAAGTSNPGPRTDDFLPFVVHGTVDEIDATRGCLRIGQHVVWVTARGMKGLELGTPVIVSGYRHVCTGGAIAELVCRAHPFPCGPLSPPASSDDVNYSNRLDSTRADPSLVLVSLLDELRVDAAVLDCSLLPSSDQYGIILHARQEGGQAVLVPRLVLERALVDPIARARVRELLRAAVEALAGPAGQRRSPAQRVLASAERPVVAGTPLRGSVTVSSEVRDVPSR